MTKNSQFFISLSIVLLVLSGCGNKDKHGHFDDLRRSVVVDDWKFDLWVENQNQLHNSGDSVDAQYLKATMYLSNSKTRKSLLYSVAKDASDYEAKYQYLSFSCKDNFYIEYKGQGHLSHRLRI